MADLAYDWGLIQQYFPADVQKLFYSIMMRESGGDAGAIANTAYPDRPGYRPPPAGAFPEYSVGPFQINVLAHTSVTADQMLDPSQNVRYAASIYASSGLQPWRTVEERNNGWAAGSTVTMVEPPGGSVSTPTPAADTSQYEAAAFQLPDVATAIGIPGAKPWMNYVLVGAAVYGVYLLLQD